MFKKDKVSRRKFIKHGSVSTIAMVASTMSPVRGQAARDLPPGYDRALVISRLGDTLIPSSPGDPGYRTLEPYNITAEIMKGVEPISDENLVLFNNESAAHFGGKTFVELSEAKRADYLKMIVDGVNIADSQVLEKLQSVYRLVRIRVFTVFYENYPQHFSRRNRDRERQLVHQQR